MRRREFLATLGLLPLVPYACERRRPALALATADTESHVAVLDAATGRVRARVATVEEPRSIEAAGGLRAVVAHTTAGAVSLLEGSPVRVRRVLRGMSEPRYTAIAPDARHAYVTDSGTGELVVIDLERGRVVGGAEVGALARHLAIAPDGRTLWVALGSKAPAVAVLDLSEPRRPRARGLLHPPFLAHDVVCSPGGRRLWITPAIASSSPSTPRAGRGRSPCCPRARRRSTSASAPAEPTWPAATTARSRCSAWATASCSRARRWPRAPSRNAYPAGN